MRRSNAYDQSGFAHLLIVVLLLIGITAGTILLRSNKLFNSLVNAGSEYSAPQFYATLNKCQGDKNFNQKYDFSGPKGVPDGCINFYDASGVIAALKGETTKKSSSVLSSGSSGSGQGGGAAVYTPSSQATGSGGSASIGQAKDSLVSMMLTPSQLNAGSTLNISLSGPLTCATNLKIYSEGFKSCAQVTGSCQGETCTGSTSCTVSYAPGSYVVTSSANNNPSCIQEAAFTVTPLTVNHRIGIRSGSSGGEFYDKVTGQIFIPRGNNYIRLAYQPVPNYNTNYWFHSTFDIGRYDRNRAQSSLAQMSQSGYNIVRVFFNEWVMGDKNGGVSTEYLRNVADFLNLAKANNIYVMLTFASLPTQGYEFNYWDSSTSQGETLDSIGWMNHIFLMNSAINQKIKFMKDVILGLNALEAPLDIVFSYNTDNEVTLYKDQKPFSLTSGLVKTANGRTYDMSKPEQKKALLEENIVYWSDQITKAIHGIDPTSLIGPGFYTPAAVSDPAENRITAPRSVMANPEGGGSIADFVDIHIYPGFRNMQDEMDSIGISPSQTRKPIILGEFGSYRRFNLSNITAAATAMKDFQIDTCRRNFKGWLYWTWDTTEGSDTFADGIYTVLESGGVINAVLAPVKRADPCY